MTEHIERTEMEKLQLMERKATMIDTPKAAARMEKMRLMKSTANTTTSTKELETTATTTTAMAEDMPKVATKMDRAEMMKDAAETATPTKELARTTATAMIFIAMAAAAIAMAAAMSTTTDVENAACDCTRHGECSRPKREPCERVVQSKGKCAQWQGAPMGVQIALSMRGGAPNKKEGGNEAHLQTLKV